MENKEERFRDKSINIFNLILSSPIKKRPA